MLTDKNIDAVFNVFDANNDGYIGVEELKLVFHGHLDNVKDSGLESESMMVSSISQTAFEDKAWTKILEQGDVDGDGRLSKAEFRKCMGDISRHRATVKVVRRSNRE